jgi:hypothetical protein
MPGTTDAASRWVDVFIPEEFSSWRPPPAAGIVGSLDATRLVVDYQSEGNTYADRVRVAAEHFMAQTPTTQRRELLRSEVIPVGFYNARDGEVVLDSYLRELVMRFLAIEPGTPQATSALRRECRSTHLEHERRRHIRHLLATAGKNRARAEVARECARRYGHDDLLR